MLRALRIICVEEDSDPREVPLMAGIAAVDSDVNLIVAALIRWAEGAVRSKERAGRRDGWCAEPVRPASRKVVCVTSRR
jgi:hypothetical protein